MGLDDAEPTAAQESSDFYEPATKSGSLFRVRSDQNFHSWLNFNVDVDY